LYSKTPGPTPRTFEKFPAAMRVNAVAILAAAAALTLSNHCAYGLRPRESRYSRTSTERYGNINVTIVKERSERSGNYLFTALDTQTYGPDSTSNPYGAGSPYNPNSVNNPYGRYGSPYSPKSANNPYTTDAPRLYA